MTKWLIRVIDFYRNAVSPYRAPTCRFIPSCSAYAKDALVGYGALKGSYLILGRLLRCHPFHPGGYDPVRLEP